MAKEMKSLQLVIEVPYTTGNVQGTPKLAQANYVCCDSADPQMTKPSGLGPNDSPAVPRDLDSGDLTGTVQALLDAVEGEAKTKEGIA